MREMALMKMDDAILLAYADGELTPQERQIVDKEIGASAEALACVALLRASRLSYHEAFSQQKLPPVPASLIAKIEASARAATKAQELNNVVEQDHRAIKCFTWPMPGLKDFDSTRVILRGVEVTHMIKKGKMKCAIATPLPAANQFYSLAS
jgi:transposase-like protein